MQIGWVGQSTGIPDNRGSATTRCCPNQSSTKTNNKYGFELSYVVSGEVDFNFRDEDLFLQRERNRRGVDPEMPAHADSCLSNIRFVQQIPLPLFWPRMSCVVSVILLKLAAGGLGELWIWKYAGLPAPNMTWLAPGEGRTRRDIFQKLHPKCCIFGQHQARCGQFQGAPNITWLGRAWGREGGI